jgi:hypothetical protein
VLRERGVFMQENSKVRNITVVGDYLPRKCGIATFTSDLLAGVAVTHSQGLCFTVSVTNVSESMQQPGAVSGMEACIFYERNKTVKDSLPVEFQWDGGPSKLTDEQFEKLTDHLLKIAYGDDLEAIAAVRRQAQTDAGEVLDVGAVPALSS